jgi:glycosyltransferase involved in cell wall biosynthesis
VPAGDGTRGRSRSFAAASFASGGRRRRRVSWPAPAGAAGPRLPSLPAPSAIPLKHIVLSATSDIVTDQRVSKVARTLHDAGYAVTVVGREKRDSMPMHETPYRVVRLRLRYEAGPQFYAEFNLRLFHFLVRQRVDVLNANDLDTLLANSCAAALKRVPIVYDSHEYFTGVPEIQHRPAVRRTWEAIERLTFPRVFDVFTVNDSIAELYRAQYGREVRVLRNLPRRSRPITPASRAALGLPEDRFVLILQGAGINVDRGAEEAVEAMRHVEGALLLVVGSGDVIPALRQRVQEDELLRQRVRILGRRPWEELMQLTAAADLGLTLDKDTNVNYRFSLPNKLFDYIKAGTPVLASRLVEIEKIVTGYDIGTTIPSHDPREIARTIREIMEDGERRARWHRNLPAASRELCWESQEEDLLAVYARAAEERQRSRALRR